MSTHKLSIRILSHTPRSTHWITPDTATIHTQRIKLVTPYSEKGYLTPIGQAITYTQDKIQSYHTNHTYQTYSPTHCSAVNKYERERPVGTSPFYTLPNQLHASGTFGSRGDAMGGALGGNVSLLEPGASPLPQMKRELQWKNWLTRASLLAVKVVIVNCNGTV